jgi:hypothetical protein
MYTFKDLDGKKLTLRPEGTASVVRATLSTRCIFCARLRNFTPAPCSGMSAAGGAIPAILPDRIEALGTSSAAMDGNSDAIDLAAPRSRSDRS